MQQLVVSVARRWRYFVLWQKYRHHTEFVLNLDDITVIFDTTDPYARQWFYPRYEGGKIHEERVTRMLVEHLKQATCFADVGAYLGFYTCLAARYMPHGAVYGFEMDPFSYTLLQRNVQRNQCHNVTILHAAVTNHDGTLRPLKAGNTPGPQRSIVSAYASDTAASQGSELPAVSLDQFFAYKDRLPEVIKIDVEGAETRVLAGMRHILQQSAPTLFIEVHPRRLQEFQSSVQEVLSILLEHSYQVFEITEMRSSGTDMVLRPVESAAEIEQNTMLYAHP
jgi:FkbM family methyltransferase